MPSSKIVLISDGLAADLKAHLASLDLPRRACSLPTEAEPEPELNAFIELWGELDELRRVVSRWPFASRGWIVEEHIPMAYERSWPSGEESPGIRMISTIVRREGMTREAFARHWLGPHTEVARSYTIPVWNYCQNVIVERLDSAIAKSSAARVNDGEADGALDEPDGFVGMHFRSEADLRARWQDHPDEAAVGAEDAARFMAIERSKSITARETVWDGPGRGREDRP